MVLSITISKEAEAQLKALAEAAGLTPEQFAQRQIEHALMTVPSIAILSGALGKAFEDSGTSDDELSEFLETEKHAMRKTRRANGGK